MSRVKFVVLNSIALIVLGSALVSFTIEFAWMLVSGGDQLPAGRLVFNFGVGLCISTVLILLQLYIIRFKRRTVVGYLLTAVCIAALLFLIYLHTGLTIGLWDLDAKWLVIFLVVESLSMLLVAYWYRQIEMYNQKLETKKALLKAKRTQ